MAQAVVVVLGRDPHSGLLGLFTNKEVAAHSVRFSYQKMNAEFRWDNTTTYVAKLGSGEEHWFTIREQVVHEQVEHL